MKVIEYTSENFWELLDEQLSLRQIETNVKIDEVVKTILEDIIEKNPDLIISIVKQNTKFKTLF